MRKILFSLAIAIVAICSCSTERKPEVFIQPELDSIMQEAVKSHPKDDIFRLIFFPLDNKQYFYICCSPGHYYSKQLDDCFEKDGKLFTCFGLKGSWKDSLIVIPKELSCLDTLKHYSDFSNADVNYDHESYRKCFMILSKDKCKEVEDPFMTLKQMDYSAIQTIEALGGVVKKMETDKKNDSNE